MAELFGKWISGLDRTRKVAFGRISSFLGATEINADAWEELEAMLIQADLGIDVTGRYHHLTSNPGGQKTVSPKQVNCKNI